MASVIEDPVVEPRLPDRYEVVNGEIVELPPMSDYARRIANRLKTIIDRYLVTHDIGECGVELLFRIPLPEDRSRNREPDVAFVSYERWPRDRPGPYTGNARDVVPDLAVEVVSPGDTADDLLLKVREYLRGGVRLVWVIYPAVREVHAYSPDGQIRAFLPTNQLEAPEILPGFQVLVTDLFPPVADPPAAASN